MDREKVIKGLSIHKSYGNDCTGCPYQCDDLEICVENLCNDALALLKEQPQKYVLNQAVTHRDPEDCRYAEKKGNCPSCNAELWECENPNYCGFCGREVLWK